MDRIPMSDETADLDSDLDFDFDDVSDDNYGELNFDLDPGREYDDTDLVDYFEEEYEDEANDEFEEEF